MDKRAAYGKYRDLHETPKYFFGRVVPLGGQAWTNPSSIPKHLHRKRFGNCFGVLDECLADPFEDRLSVFPRSAGFLFFPPGQTSIMTIHKLLFRVWNTVASGKVRNG
jgi:hypothetical protein